VTYAIFRLQGYLPVNPQHLPGVTPALAWNTSVSFATNTNWQAYAGETTMSYLSQMGALAVQNFVSAAVGIAVAVALIRGFCRRGAKTIGNFWVDLAELDVGPLHLDLVHCEAALDGRLLDLTAKEFDFLAFLARHAGKVCTRRMILQSDPSVGYRLMPPGP
jgi:Potassium-transporting ATPase A subunit